MTEAEKTMVRMGEQIKSVEDKTDAIMLTVEKIDGAIRGDGQRLRYNPADRYMSPEKSKHTL